LLGTLAKKTPIALWWTATLAIAKQTGPMAPALPPARV
jgi:hypothetical protein